MIDIETHGRATAARSIEDVNVYAFKAGEFLFREGERKSRIFRIESGAVCTYQVCGPERQRTVEVLHRGDWIGFGYLDHHISRARALAETRVSCYPRGSVDLIAETDVRAQHQLADSIEQEFEFQRAESSKRATDPLVRVSALLLSLASLSRNEGRGATVVVDAVSSGLVAECLMMTLDTLAATLRALHVRGLIEPEGCRMRLLNIAALEAIADGDDMFSAHLRSAPDEVGSHYGF